jgi:hypothetical protein
MSYLTMFFNLPWHLELNKTVGVHSLKTLFHFKNSQMFLAHSVYTSHSVEV